MNFGEGITPSGTGSFSRGGLYAQGVIGNVTNQNGSDLRADVFSQTGIEVIDLSDGGAIVDADIFVQGGVPVEGDTVEVDVGEDDAFRRGGGLIQGLFERTAEFGPFGFGNIDPSAGDSLERPIFEIDSIRASGGIVGSTFNAYDTRDIVAGGVGLLNSTIRVQGNSRLNSVVADGLGIRDTSIEGAGDIGSIVATGNGRVLDINAVAPDGLIFAATGEFDPFTGQGLTAANDVFLATGTSPRVSRVSGTTNAGVIGSSVITASRDADEIRGFAVIGPADDVAVESALYPMRISVGDDLGSLSTIEQIDGLNLTAGEIDRIASGGDMARTVASVSGRLGTVEVGKTLRGTTDLRITGPSGRINDIRVGRSMFAQVVTFNRLRNLTVDGFFGGIVRVRQGAINDVRVGRDVVGGGEIIVDSVIRDLNVGGNVDQGALVFADDGFGEIDIDGAVFGTVTSNL